MVRLQDIMTRDMVTVPPETTLRDVSDLLSSAHITGVPVVAGGKVVGVVSTTDLLEFECSHARAPVPREVESDWEEFEEEPSWDGGEDPPSLYFSELWSDAGAELPVRFATTDRPEWDVLEQHTVSEVMTRELCVLPPETPMPEAAAYMLEAGIHRVLVAENGRLVGVVSTVDLVRAVAELGLGW